ncbi:LptA/OstA family protein [Altererythrobacter sp. B11]|uniref:LptA/OstA family protein n=1 Tax=Altererythrobacter sp. B11 TaxID=2060312 RepID=UPI001E3B1858|nr:LptA/OstA family protein [Altererythrobacter sp. B11]
MDNPPAPRPDSRRAALTRRMVRSLVGGFAAAAIAGLGFQTLAGAQTGVGGFNANQPVEYGADRIELQDRQNRIVLSGNVEFNQGDLRLTADRTTVAYNRAGSGLQIERVNATGGVTVTRGGERAMGNAGIYDVGKRVIILTGGVQLRRNGDTLNGGRLVMDLNTGVSSVDGRGGTASGAQTGGRVTGSFSVPENSASGN